jgi:hypothetical protein
MVLRGKSTGYYPKGMSCYMGKETTDIVPAFESDEKDEELLRLMLAYRQSLGRIPALAYAKRFEQVYRATPVEVVSPKETYIVFIVKKFPKAKNDIAVIRGPRICGKTRSGNNDRIKCLQSPGFKTAHKGMGRCSKHDQGIARSAPLTILAAMEDEGLAMGLRDALVQCPSLLSDGAIGRLDEEIVVARYLLAQALQGHDKRAVAAWLDLLTRMKGTRAKIETERLLLSPKALNLFVEAIVQVAKDILPDTYYEEFIRALYSRVKVPINEKARELLLPAEIETVQDDSGEVGV